MVYFYQTTLHKGFKDEKKARKITVKVYNLI